MNLFFLPLICPSCGKKIFFCRDKKNKKIYTVTDQIESLIEPHICSLIEGEKYWKNNTFKEYLKINFTAEDNIFQLVQNNLAPKNLSDVFLTKKMIFNNLGLLLRYESLVANKQCLDLLTNNFVLCKVFIKSQRKWELGRWLSTYGAKMLIKEQFSVAKIQYFEISPKKTLDKLARHLSSLELSSKDSELLEIHEKNICSAIQKVGRVNCCFSNRKKIQYHFALFF